MLLIYLSLLHVENSKS